MGPLKFEFRRPSLTASGEVGSLAELVGILQDEGSSLVKMFGDDMELVVQSVGGATEGQQVTAHQDGSITVKDGDAPARRGRKPKGATDPATAQAPPPAPIPAAAPPAPAAPVDLNAVNANGLPAFLDRTGQQQGLGAPVAAAAPPPPPLLPAAPPVAPAAPPVSGPVGAKIIAELDKRATGAADGGQALADWLASAGITIKGATYAEAVSVLRMTADEKLAGVATALSL